MPDTNNDIDNDIELMDMGLIEFEKRKQDHIQLALDPSNQASNMNCLDRITLMHEALPDLDFEQISLLSARFGKPVAKPFLVSSMTAGHAQSSSINRNLIAACEQTGWVMGVGSQRRELMDKTAAAEWQPLKCEFPNVHLLSNLGITQLIQTPLSDIQRLVDAIEAEALIIHCNPLQELIQPEGTPQFKGCWQSLAHLVRHIALPVVIKETGCGFSIHTLKRLNEIGVAAVDVSGLGGTHWGRIEGGRAPEHSLQYKTAITFRNWGIDTVTSVHNAFAVNPNFEVWGSGGVRHGLDAARLFALGVSSVGFAKPMLDAALKGSQEVIHLMQNIEYELKVAMFCTGSAALQDLKGKICQ